MHEPKTLRSPHFRGKSILTKHIEQSVLNTYRGVCMSGVSFKRCSTVHVHVLCSDSLDSTFQISEFCIDVP